MSTLLHSQRRDNTRSHDAGREEVGRGGQAGRQVEADFPWHLMLLCSEQAFNHKHIRYKRRQNTEELGRIQEYSL